MTDSGVFRILSWKGGCRVVGSALQRTARWERGMVITVKFLDGDQGLKTRFRGSAWQRVSPGLANLQFAETK
jgi:hypothetical protein